jgi:predicted exporter
MNYSLPRSLLRGSSPDRHSTQWRTAALPVAIAIRLAIQDAERFRYRLKRHHPVPVAEIPKELHVLAAIGADINRKIDALIVEKGDKIKIVIAAWIWEVF